MKTYKLSPLLWFRHGLETSCFTHAFIKQLLRGLLLLRPFERILESGDIPSHGEGLKGFLVADPAAQPGPGQNWEVVDMSVSSLPVFLACLSLGCHFRISAICFSPVICVFQSELLTFVILGCEWPV